MLNRATSPGSSTMMFNVKRKLDNLFFSWLGQDEAQERCRQLLNMSATGQLTSTDASENKLTAVNSSPSALAKSSSSQFTPAPPLSPKSRAKHSTKSLKSPKSSPLRSPRSPPPRSPKNLKNSFSPSLSPTSPTTEAQKHDNDHPNNEQKQQPHAQQSSSLDDFTLDTATTPKDKKMGSKALSPTAPSPPNSPPTSPPPASITAAAPPTSSATAAVAAAVTATTGTPSAPSTAQIPPFYIPNEGGRGRGRPLEQDTLESRQDEITSLFEEYTNGMSHENFVAVTKDLCNLPSFFSTPLHIRVRLLWLGKKEKEMKESAQTELKTNKKKTAAFETLTQELLSEDGLVTQEMFVHFWTLEIQPYDRYDRFFRLIKRPDRTFIFPSDFDPFLKELLKYHPGLEFLESAPEFQDKYMRTVTARIFFSVDRFHRWRLTSRDLRRSEPNLLSAFDAVDENDDINMVHDYFSYEHFYVLYCKFWELDTDRDFLIDRDDLLRYGGHALTRRTIDRVFEQSGRQFLCSTEGKMGYEDFCFFMLAEEDKSTRASIQYWFNVIDLDSDGVIRPFEMKLFYDEQLHRMECLGHELVPFQDIYCQMCDLVALRPLANGGSFDEFRLNDFLSGGPDHMQLCGNFFNMLFNLNKFVAFEQRDPFLLKQQRTEGGQLMTLWARFAAIEYARLAMEEEMREQEQVQANANGWNN